MVRNGKRPWRRMSGRVCDSVKISGVETVGDVSYFLIDCRRDSKEWCIRRRYSAFDELRKVVSRELGTLTSNFPAKQLFGGRLSGAQTEKRREQLEVWLSELCALMEMPSAMRLSVTNFIDEPIDKVEDSVLEERVSKPAPIWDESFMSSDPLASIVAEPAVPQGSPSVAVRQEEAPLPAPPPRSPRELSAPVGTAPSFLLSQGVDKNKKGYELSGEGLRDAVKNGDLDGVQRVLEANPKLANYEDRQRESMLHLAALFNHTEIALVLISAGANPEAKNQSQETPLDLALPSLKSKLSKAREAYLSNQV